MKRIYIDRQLCEACKRCMLACIAKHNEYNYQKLILEGNKLKGVIFQGEIDGSGVYGRMIKDGIDLSNKLDNIFNLTYADFFKENNDGVFSY